MRQAHIRGWLFDFAGFESEVANGPRISIAGGIEMVEDAFAIRQAIYLLLRTRPGERVMRPEYGCDLHQLLFAPNDETTAGLAIHYVQRALDLWEPRIDVLRLDANRDPDRPELLRIELDYRMRSTRGIGSLTLPLNLNGD